MQMCRPQKRREYDEQKTPASYQVEGVDVPVSDHLKNDQIDISQNQLSVPVSQLDDVIARVGGMMCHHYYLCTHHITTTKNSQ